MPQEKAHDPSQGADGIQPALDHRTAEQLLPMVYAELRRLAQSRLRHERRDHSLAATALVHEAFLRIVGDRQAGWDSREQFFAAAAEAIRRILVEHARSRGRTKRGGGWQRITLGGLDLSRDEDLDQALAVDEAFQQLLATEPRAAEVVRLRFYAGLGEEETAAVLGLNARTVRREWSYARAFLFAALRERN